MGLRMSPSQSFRSTSRSMSGRSSASVMLLGFLGSRAISRVFQLGGTVWETHKMLSALCKDLNIGIGVACSTLIVRPVGPGDLVPVLCLVWYSMYDVFGGYCCSESSWRLFV